MPIKVLVVDDSALIRQLLSEIINNEADMLLVGAAPDAFVAKKWCKSLSLM
jgi:two-component system chemotaxis response regulator CheB